MTTATALNHLRLEACDPATIAGARGSWPSLDPADQAALERLDLAGERGGLTVMTATADAGLVGYAAVSCTPEADYLDPIVTALGLPTLDADRVCRELVTALLQVRERPRAPLAVHAKSPATRVLIRAGWRAVKTPPTSPYALFSAADI